MFYRASSQSSSDQYPNSGSLTPRSKAAYRSETTEVSLTKDQQARLNELSARTGRPTDELVQEAVDRMFAYNQWFKEQVQVGLDQIARGQLIDE